MDIVIAAPNAVESIAQVTSYWLAVLELPHNISQWTYSGASREPLQYPSVASSEEAINVVLLPTVTALFDISQDKRAEGALEILQDYAGSCAGAMIVVGNRLRSASGGGQSEHHILDRASEGWLASATFLDVVAIFKRYGVGETNRASTAATLAEARAAALGTAIARAIHSHVVPARKVIVVDCDDTLWDGACAETDLLHLLVTEPRQWLQRFLVSQVEAGALLCLCSKNSEQDVQRVLDEHPRMVLRRRHVAAARVNWREKVDNVISLCAELQCAPESVIFVDNDPIECYEMQRRLPEVVTIQLPCAPEDIPAMFEHMWIFDRSVVTAEDRDRTTQRTLYGVREGVRSSAADASEVVGRLGIKVAVESADDSSFPRIAQLSQRVTQLNCTLRQWTVPTLTALRRRSIGRPVILATHASDRFGDYGLVGAIVATVRDDTLFVDTFVLSCRALGRQVEFKMIRAVEEWTVRLRLRAACIVFKQGSRNQPAKQFLESCEPRWERSAVEEMWYWSPALECVGEQQEVGNGPL